MQNKDKNKEVFFDEWKEDGHIIREKMQQYSTVEEVNGEVIQKEKKMFKLDISPDKSAPIIKKISKKFLKEQDDKYGTLTSYRVEKGTGISDNEKDRLRKQRHCFKEVAKAETVLEKLTLWYF